VLEQGLGGVFWGTWVGYNEVNNVTVGELAAAARTCLAVAKVFIHASCVIFIQLLRLNELENGLFKHCS
jgi:hypothetical protein